MSRAERRGVWGIPWLGLPLAGILALSVAAQLGWQASRADQPGGEAAAGGAGLLAAAAAADEIEAVRPPDRTARLRSGETLSAVLLSLGLSPEETYLATQVSASFVDARTLRAGTPWAAYLGNGLLERFELTIEGKGELTLNRWSEGWDPEWRPFERRARIRAIRGELVGSLEASMARAGAPAELAFAVADVLQWDLDFSRDLRRGDEFRVLFEEVLIEGYEPRPSRVLAVDYGHPGKRHLEAYWFDAADGGEVKGGYYDAEGRPLQKMFLRSPMPYSRITSRFTSRRFHPVLKSFRPHYGVDYGAPVGTPVRATASGTVVQAGWDGGGGKTVKIRHPNGYLSAYLHLSRFAVQRGARVRQGDLIAYTGATGLASGPHLDYRIQKNGRWIDPLSIKAVPVEAVTRLRIAEFDAVREAMRASLDTGIPFAPPAVTVAREAARIASSGSPAALPARSN